MSSVQITSPNLHFDVDLLTGGDQMIFPLLSNMHGNDAAIPRPRQAWERLAIAWVKAWRFFMGFCYLVLLGLGFRDTANTDVAAIIPPNMTFLNLSEHDFLIVKKPNDYLRRS